jgi:hypothetical protein
MIKDSSKLVKLGKYGGARIYIPSNLLRDSQFPIEIGEEIEIKIDTKKRALIISSSKQEPDAAE